MQLGVAQGYLPAGTLRGPLQPSRCADSASEDENPALTLQHLPGKACACSLVSAPAAGHCSRPPASWHSQGPQEPSRCAQSCICAWPQQQCMCFSTCLGTPAHAASSVPLQLGVAQGHLPAGTLRGPLEPSGCAFGTSEVFRIYALAPVWADLRMQPRQYPCSWELPKATCQLAHSGNPWSPPGALSCASALDHSSNVCVSVPASADLRMQRLRCLCSWKLHQATCKLARSWAPCSRPDAANVLATSWRAGTLTSLCLV